jgi:large repetitive protein
MRHKPVRWAARRHLPAILLSVVLVGSALWIPAPSSDAVILGPQAYIVNTIETSAARIDLSEGQAYRSNIDVHTQPRALAITPGGEAWVANACFNSVTVTDIRNGNSRILWVGNEPYDIAVTPDGSMVYVLHRWDRTVLPFERTAGDEAPGGVHQDLGGALVEGGD